MLVTFKTDVGNITMFGSDALQMIKMMGHSETVPGAILADDVPQALSRLKAALKAEKAPPSTDENEDEVEPAVSTAHRGLPLVNLLTAAVTAGCDVMWE
ncbi:DUF1840 domain-containing protein [Nitrosomonas sp.]|uniref:DUF1840 domain-containing protein n=1 Tax=Nitrosomonas sp. TaxID=42353 RepID=UPI00285020CD|nr:DUF1840 domain-containing protein [Nitrosomonas sp.]MDR4515004.1 DUF1840 domain-containing protein [Nitrosomonas sp.]